MADRCDILGSDGFRCVLWLGHRGEHYFDTYGNPLLTDRDYTAVEEFRRLWENRNIEPAYQWISRDALEYIKPVYRHYPPSEVVGTVIRITAFGQEDTAWLVVGYDRVRDWYYVRRGPPELRQPSEIEETRFRSLVNQIKDMDWIFSSTHSKTDNSPSLGGRSGLSGREPMLSRKAKK